MCIRDRLYLDQESRVVKVGTNTVHEAFVARRLRDTCMEALDTLCAATVAEAGGEISKIEEVEESVQTLTTAIAIALPVSFAALCALFMCGGVRFGYTHRLKDDDDDDLRRRVVIHNNLNNNNNSDTVGPRNNRSTRNYNSQNQTDDSSSRSYSYNDNNMGYETEFEYPMVDTLYEEAPFLDKTPLKISTVRRMGQQGR